MISVGNVSFLRPTNPIYTTHKLQYHSTHQRHVRRIENDRFRVFTKSPWNLFIPCVNVQTNPLDSLFTDDRRVIELTAKSQAKCLYWRKRNKMAVIGKGEKRKSKSIKLTDLKCWNHVSDCILHERDQHKSKINKQWLHVFKVTSVISIKLNYSEYWKSKST
jgi:phosphoketolase